MSNELMFKQQTSGGGSSGVDGILETALQDYTLPGDNNSGLTSNADTNPVSEFFGDTDASSFRVKTVWIRDAVLVEDRSKWIRGMPTYELIFNQFVPNVRGYIAGKWDFWRTNERAVEGIRLADPSTVIALVGDFQIAALIHNGEPFVPGSGAAGFLGTLDNAAAETAGAGPFLGTRQDGGLEQPGAKRTFVKVSSPAALPTDDLHAYTVELLSPETGALRGAYARVHGFQFFTSPDSIRQRPGRTYVNRTLVETSTGATLLPAAQNASLYHQGTKSTVFKSAAGSYGISTMALPLVSSQVSGLSGSNIVSVGVGVGGSFPTGSGFALQVGSSLLYGVVQLQSSDVLQVGPTLPFGAAGGTLTRAFISGQSLPAIGATYELFKSFTLSGTNWLQNGIRTGQLMDLEKGCWLQPLFSVGETLAQGVGGICSFLAGGNFQALEMEGFFPTALPGSSSENDLGGTFLVDGLAAFSMLAAINTPWHRKTIVTDLGMGVHTAGFYQAGGVEGGSTNTFVVTKVNLYRVKGPSVAGALASIDENQTRIDRAASAYNPFLGGAPIGMNRYYPAPVMGIAAMGISSAFTSFDNGFSLVFGMNVQGSSLQISMPAFYGSAIFFGGSAAAGAGSSGSFFSGTAATGLTVTHNAVTNLPSEGFWVPSIFAGPTTQIYGIGTFSRYSELTSLLKKQAFPGGELPINGASIAPASIPVRALQPAGIGWSVGIGGIARSGNVGAFSGVSAFTFVNSIISLETRGGPVELRLVSSAPFFSGDYVGNSCLIEVWRCNLNSLPVPFTNLMGVNNASLLQVFDQVDGNNLPWRSPAGALKYNPFAPAIDVGAPPGTNLYLLRVFGPTTKILDESTQIWARELK